MTRSIDPGQHDSSHGLGKINRTIPLYISFFTTKSWHMNQKHDPAHVNGWKSFFFFHLKLQHLARPLAKLSHKQTICLGDW
ncbi:hypothetical protein Hanom_Chr15g01363961 [Helianthus anomalus]